MNQLKRNTEAEENTAQGAEFAGEAEVAANVTAKKVLNATGEASIETVMDVPLTVTAELGSCQMPIRKILMLTQGSIIELSKFAGEPLDFFVNGRYIAKGEVIVVNEKFGIRLTDVISSSSREASAM